MKNSSRPKFRKKAKPDPASLKERRRFVRIFRPFWPKNASTSTKPGIRGDKRAQRAWRSPKASCARARRNAPSLETGYPARFFQKERPSVGFPSILAEECLNLSEAGNSQRQTHTEDSDALRNLQARKCAESGNRPVGNGRHASSSPRTRRFWAQTLRLSSVQESRFPNLFSRSLPGAARSHSSSPILARSPPP